MTNLTEQWKRGELKRYKKYYVKTPIGIYPKTYNKRGFKGVVEEVLCEVPSYEQWQQMKAFCEEFNALNVAEENQRLKSLLKEWMHYYPIILYEHEDTLKTKDIVELYDKTREELKWKTIKNYTLNPFFFWQEAYGRLRAKYEALLKELNELKNK